MEKETRKILNIIKKEDGYHCGWCPACRRIEESIDRIVKRLRAHEEAQKNEQKTKKRI